MRGHHDGLHGSGKVTSELFLLLIGANWKARFQQVEIMAGTSYTIARAKAAPWRTPLRATVLTRAGMAHRRSSSRTPPTFTSLTVTRAASRRVANSSSRVDNTKNHQNKAVDIWTKILDKGNLTDHPSLSIGSRRAGHQLLLTPKFGNVIANEKLQKKVDNLMSMEF